MKKSKSIIMLSLCVASLIVGIVCSISSLIGYAILAFTVSVLFGLFGFNFMLSNRNPEQVYDNEVKDILNTYDSILLKCSSVPDFDHRNIIKVESMDDLVDAQFEIRKPICYLKQSESCSFMLLDEKEVYVYVTKIDDEVLSPVEIEINNMKFRKKENTDMDSEMLQDIDKTTIIKLSNKKSYRVSPIRKKKEDKKDSTKKNDYQVKLDDVEVLDDVETVDVGSSNEDVEILDF